MDGTRILLVCPDVIVEAFWYDTFSMWSYAYHSCLDSALHSVTYEVEDAVGWLPRPVTPKLGQDGQAPREVGS